MPRDRQKCPLVWRLHLAEWLYGEVMCGPVLQCFRASVGPQQMNWATYSSKSTWREKRLGEVQLFLVGVRSGTRACEPCWVSSFTISVA